MVGDWDEVIRGRAEIQDVQVLDSCAFTWIFDGATRLFRRIPRYAHVSLDAPSPWTPYHRLDIDSRRSCFVVRFNEEETRLLRAWLHVDPCDRCSAEWETLGDSKQRLQWWKQRLNVVDQRLLRGQIGRNHPLRPFGGWATAEGAL